MYILTYKIFTKQRRSIFGFHSLCINNFFVLKNRSNELHVNEPSVIHTYQQLPFAQIYVNICFICTQLPTCIHTRMYVCADSNRLHF